jgi:hypothetical protein
MNFRDVAVKNFKGSMRKYISYFLCNSFSVMMLFMFSTLIYSKELTASPLVEKGFSKILVLPSVVLIFFSIIFISYSYSGFMRSRKKEFGLFMNLGMSIWDIRKIILVENILIAAASILSGIIFGTIFARLFFLIMIRIIGLQGINFIISVKSYFYSVGIFSGIFTISLLLTLISTIRYEIVNLLKADRVIESNKLHNPLFAVIGLALLLGSIVVLYKWFDGEGPLLLVCTIGIFIGLYITISQLGELILRLVKSKKNAYYNNLVLITNLNYKFKQTKKIIFTVAIMTVVIIFISGFYLSLVLSAEDIAVNNNPFHISFIQSQRNNVSDEEIKNIIKDSESSLLEHKVMEFVEIDRNIIISVDQLNSAINKRLNVNKGKYIKLVQVREYSEKEKADIYNNDSGYYNRGPLSSLKNQEYIFDVLFNGPGYLFTHCIILNNDDYNALLAKNSSFEKGKLNLYNFKDWKKTQPIVNKLEDTFRTLSKDSITTGRQGYYTRVASRVGTYNENKQGTKMLFYLLSLLGVFFFVATSIILFLRLFSELDYEKAKYKKMYRIGITENEIKKNISREFAALFFIGPIIGIPISIIYTIIFAKDTPAVIYQIIQCDLIISLIFLVFEAIYYFISRKSYYNEIIDSL